MITCNEYSLKAALSHVWPLVIKYYPLLVQAQSACSFKQSRFSTKLQFSGKVLSYLCTLYWACSILMLIIFLNSSPLMFRTIKKKQTGSCNEPKQRFLLLLSLCVVGRHQPLASFSLPKQNWLMSNTVCQWNHLLMCICVRMRQFVVVICCKVCQRCHSTSASGKANKLWRQTLALFSSLESF